MRTCSLRCSTPRSARWASGGASTVCSEFSCQREALPPPARLIRLHPDAEEATGPPPAEIQRAIDGIVTLLTGQPDDLRDVAIDLSEVPPFHQRVYEAARQIEPGHTMTYGEIAARLGEPRASREVGQALGQNPFPLIVPCHRVLAAGGKLGGFSARGGVTTKLRLLNIEGAEPNGQPALF
jgi:methylated-DNA-[protein]-cysteine S-methyltransferase